MSNVAQHETDPIAEKTGIIDRVKQFGWKRAAGVVTAASSIVAVEATPLADQVAAVPGIEITEAAADVLEPNCERVGYFHDIFESKYFTDKAHAAREFNNGNMSPLFTEFWQDYVTTDLSEGDPVFFFGWSQGYFDFDDSGIVEIRLFDQHGTLVVDETIQKPEYCDDQNPYPFIDVPSSSFAYEDIRTIYEVGITTGTSPNTYSPHDVVTREQMASFLVRLYETASNEEVPLVEMPFIDVPENSYARHDIAKLHFLNITTGTSPNTYSPHDVVTREQMASFLARTYRLLDLNWPVPDESPFIDVAEASFAVEDIDLIYQLGITTGTSPNTYSPHDVVTREQMASFLARLLTPFI